MRLFLFLFLIVYFSSCNEYRINESLKIFRYNESSNISSLDPAFSKDQASVWVTSQIFNGLVQLDKDLNIIPCISKKWHISEDGLEYLFNLRSDIFFHDHPLFKEGKGRRVIASDFEYSFNRIIDSKTLSPGAWVFSNVKEFSAINDSIFKIKLINPFPAFLGLLSMQYCSVVPKEIVENVNFNLEPIGTGPFFLKIWQDQVKLVLRKNTNYFEYQDNRQLPFLDAVSITFIKDKQSAFLRFLQGKLDFVSGIDASYKDELLTKKGNLRKKYSDKITMQTQPYLNTEYLGFLMDDTASIFHDINIRKSINYGFDRVKMIKYLRNNIGTPALQGFIPDGFSFKNTSNGYFYDPEKSKYYLMKSKYFKDGNKIPITISTTSSYLDLCEFIQHQLSQIGFDVTIDVNPPSTHRQMVAVSNLGFFRGSWIADYPDAENYLSLFYSKNHSPKGPNYTHFSNHLFDSLYVASLSEINDSNRQLMYVKMDQIIIDESAIVPLYYDQVLRFSHKDVLNFYSNPMNSLVLKTVDKL